MRCSIIGRVFVLMVVLAACGSDDSGQEVDATGGDAGAPDGGMLRLATSFPVTGLDPIDDGMGNVSFGVAETPLLLSAQGTPEPHLVDYERIDDRTWRLRIEDGVTFHNGAQLDGEALAASMRRHLEQSPQVQTQLPDAEVEATGELEVTLTTLRPHASVPSFLADPSMFAVFDVAAVEQADDTEALLSAGHYTGPYTPIALDEQRFVSERYDDYWQGTPPLEGVEVRFVPDEQARILAVQNGEIDVALYPPSNAEELLAAEDGLAFPTSEIVAEGFRVVLDHREPPFDDRNVRRAFGLAIDEEALAEDVLGGPYEPAVGLLPPEFAGALENQRFDPAEAEELLDQAGWLRDDPDGPRHQDGKRLDARLVTYPQQPDLQPMAVAVQAQLADVGFDIELIQSEDINTTMEHPDEWEAAIYCCAQVSGGGAVEPVWLDYYSSEGWSNWGDAQVEELDELVRDLPELIDPDERRKAMERVQEIVIEEDAVLTYAATRARLAVASADYANYVLRPNLVFVTYETAPH